MRRGYTRNGPTASWALYVRLLEAPSPVSEEPPCTHRPSPALSSWLLQWRFGTPPTETSSDVPLAPSPASGTTCTVRSSFRSWAPSPTGSGCVPTTSSVAVERSGRGMPVGPHATTESLIEERLQELQSVPERIVGIEPAMTREVLVPLDGDRGGRQPSRKCVQHGHEDAGVCFP